MFLRTVCPSCGEAYELTPQQRGPKVRCPECQVIFAPEVEEVAEEGVVDASTPRRKRGKKGKRPRRLREPAGPSQWPLLIVIGLCVLAVLVIGTALLLYAIR